MTPSAAPSLARSGRPILAVTAGRVQARQARAPGLAPDVFGDDDGVVFVPASQAGEVLAAGRQIGEVERNQARKIQAGQTLRQQTAFTEYLARRAAEPSYTFPRHLRQIGGAIEE